MQKKKRRCAASFLFHTSDKVYKELGFFSIWLPFHMDEGLVFMLVFENYYFSSCFLSVRSSIECYVCCCVK